MSETPFDDMGLPDDLRALDEELLSLRYEERPSFGPELRAELAEQWATQDRRRPSALRRHFVAATIVGLLVGGAAVPSARASLIRLIGGLDSTPIEVEAPVRIEALAEAVVLQGNPIKASVEEAPTQPEVPKAVESEMPALVTAPVLIPPEMVDRERSQRLLQEAYPWYLQRQDIGGTVWLNLWVDSTGMAGEASVLHSSEVPALDRTALQVAPRFMFEPATQDGRRVGKWIQFPVRFEPDSTLADRVLPPVVDPYSLPTLGQADWWELREPLDFTDLSPVGASARAAVLAHSQAAAALADVFADPTVLERYGPAEAVLRGAAPEGVTPTEWRAAVGDALEFSIEYGSSIPAGFLSLGRIRARQGLHSEARSMFERGLQVAVQAPDKTGSWVLAELHYERASISRDRWLVSDGVGRVRAEAFEQAQCLQARSTGAAVYGFASIDRMLAWNYLCPMQWTSVIEAGFEELRSGSAGNVSLMMASLRAAVEAYPGHAEANTDLLLTLATQERWSDVLAGALRFSRVSQGDASGLLLAGLALHRMNRSAEAAEHFDEALSRMSDADADELIDVGFLLDRDELRWYRRVSPDERRSWEVQFWKTKDRAPSTEVNERWVEHMARATYARFRFGTVFGDAGEVWVRFGGPNSIHIVDEGSGRQTEFWNYGSGPDITFVRWTSSKRTDLTPEGRAYVDDLGKIFPPQ
jgi:TonB family protein